MVRHTIVCFHAHPDDEALLMGGTMARLSAEGHRVVLVTATAGEAGLASSQLAAQQPLGERRSEELAASADALGCARTVMLGFADSGMADHPNNSVQAFAQTPVSTAAVGLARLLRDEAAAVLTIYDPVGGYGHPDHVQVHRVGRHAAELAGTPVVLEATVDRRVLQHALRAVRPFTRGSADLKPARFRELFSDPSRITHRVDVSGFRSEADRDAGPRQPDDR